MPISLLPPSSSAVERAIEHSISFSPAAHGAIVGINQAKLITRPPSFLPFLAYEYGLDELRELIANPYDLIDLGRQWQAIRGTVPAIDMVLGWLGLAAATEEAWTGRAFWNAFQLRFSTLPASDGELLGRIERGVSASVPLRSKFRRGVYLYDVPALEADRGRLDASHLDWDSGVRATAGTRYFPEAAKWSFGRTHEIEHFYTEAEGLALDNWIEEVEGESLAWELMDYPWETADFPWETSAEIARRILLAGWFVGRRMHLVLRDANDAIIGYRRCRAVRPVAPAGAGSPYNFDGSNYQPSSAGERLFVEAMTDFEDADGVSAASVALLVGAEAVGVPAGRLWLEPGALSGGVEIAVHEIAVPLRRTVRDRFKIMLRF